MKITFFGHSAFLFEFDNHKILMDPFLTGNPKCEVLAESVEADYIVLTHGHQDHFGDTESIARRCDATVIGNFELCSYAGTFGLKTHPMHIGGQASFPFGSIKLTIAHHGSSIAGKDGLPIYLGEPAGVLLRFGDKTIFHAGDTGLFMDMQLIGELNSIDVAILPVGDNFTMGPEDAVRAVEFLKPRMVIPCHYDTFPFIELTSERLDTFEASMVELGVGVERMKPSSTLELS